MQVNRYNNPRSKRKLKKKSKVEAMLMIQGVTAPDVTHSDMFLALEKETRPDQVESVKFKKEKPLKQGSTAGGKEKLARSSTPLI